MSIIKLISLYKKAIYQILRKGPLHKMYKLSYFLRGISIIHIGIVEVAWFFVCLDSNKLNMTHFFPNLCDHRDI